MSASSALGQAACWAAAYPPCCMAQCNLRPAGPGAGPCTHLAHRPQPVTPCIPSSDGQAHTDPCPALVLAGTPRAHLTQANPARPHGVTLPARRSGIYYTTDAQRAAAEASKARQNAKLGGSVVTEIEAVANYSDAEEYHQQASRLRLAAWHRACPARSVLHGQPPSKRVCCAMCAPSFVSLPFPRSTWQRGDGSGSLRVLPRVATTPSVATAERRRACLFGSAAFCLSRFLP